MLIPLSVVDASHKYLFSFRPVPASMLSRRYPAFASDPQLKINIQPVEFAPVINLRIVQLLQGFPDKIATQSFALVSNGEVWETLIELAPSPMAHKKLLRKIERRLIAELMKEPAAANG